MGLWCLILCTAVIILVFNVLFSPLRSCEALCYFGLDVRREVNYLWKEVQSCFFVSKRNCSSFCLFWAQARGHKTAFQSPISVEGKRKLESSGLTASNTLWQSLRHHQLETSSPICCFLMTARNTQSLCGLPVSYLTCISRGVNMQLICGAAANSVCASISETCKMKSRFELVWEKHNNETSKTLFTHCSNSEK